MRGSKEIVGTLRGFDDYVRQECYRSKLLIDFLWCHHEDCIFNCFHVHIIYVGYAYTLIFSFIHSFLSFCCDIGFCKHPSSFLPSLLDQQQVNLVLDDAVEFSPDPRDKNRIIRTELHAEVLLNGNQITVLVPGGTGPSDSLVARS
jgi:small nuclear ribonucleoprotein (snRNP)-like protein